ncbi:MAG TPA: ABC transporter ATP-binding protein [archaeon]|nr:ABC transporter ATP-binding protein [archaeon]
MSASAVSVQNAKKIFSQKKEKILALDGVSFEIKKGEIFGLLGPNGAGKTTLISAICGLIELDSGSVEVFGTNVQKNRDKVIGEINLVTGFAGVLRGLTVEELLTYYSYLYSVKDKKKAIENALTLSGLLEKRNQLAYTLSSGYRQRFYIAKALLSSPKVLLMDEPTVGLDVESALKIRKLIEELKKKGLTILLTTHYMIEAEQLCDKVALISKGKIIALGTVRQLKKLAKKPRASLEDVFLFLTRKSLEEDEDEK